MENPSLHHHHPNDQPYTPLQRWLFRFTNMLMRPPCYAWFHCEPCNLTWCSWLMLMLMLKFTAIQPPPQQPHTHTHTHTHQRLQRIGATPLPRCHGNKDFHRSISKLSPGERTLIFAFPAFAQGAPTRLMLIPFGERWWQWHSFLGVNYNKQTNKADCCQFFYCTNDSLQHTRVIYM